MEPMDEIDVWLKYMPIYRCGTAQKVRVKFAWFINIFYHIFAHLWEIYAHFLPNLSRILYLNASRLLKSGKNQIWWCKNVFTLSQGQF